MTPPKVFWCALTGGRGGEGAGTEGKGGGKGGDRRGVREPMARDGPSNWWPLIKRPLSPFSSKSVAALVPARNNPVPSGPALFPKGPVSQPWQPPAHGPAAYQGTRCTSLAPDHAQLGPAAPGIGRSG